MFKAFKFSIFIFILTGLVYPIVITGLGQLFFPVEANGSLLKNADGKIIGSVLLGQSFTRPEYFHPRPSANRYDAANSGGSNLGATNKELLTRVIQAANTFRQTNDWNQAIPIDAITASGSGLDPDISMANALAQSSRVAEARKMALETVKSQVLQHTEHTITQAPYVNVLKLNLALDQLQAEGESNTH